MATGLLIVCVGRGTKAVDAFMAMTKQYSGTMRLGEGTPSQDAETPVEEQAPWEHITGVCAMPCLAGLACPGCLGLSAGLQQLGDVGACSCMGPASRVHTSTRCCCVACCGVQRRRCWLRVMGWWVRSSSCHPCTRPSR